MGDIHGAYILLLQCLERAGFDKENDTLIQIGDIADGWPYVYECVEELLTIKHRVDILGNHDEWLRRFLQTGIHPDYWMQGGQGTVISYLRAAGLLEEHGATRFLKPHDIPASHVNFFLNQRLYYKDETNRLFVHGGFDRHETLDAQAQYNPSVFYWDRELWRQALSAHDIFGLKFKEDFAEIFIGHTETQFWTKLGRMTRASVFQRGSDPTCAPMHADIIYNVDTGAGSTGCLTIMNIETKEFWQSDPVNTIYGSFNYR